MSRTFTSMAVLLTLALLATIGVGFYSFALDVSEHKKDVFLIHFYLGLTTAFAILLVHCLIFTYFLGTGRWVKEVGMAYRLPDVPYPKATRELKRRAFPPALFSMLTAIATAAAGAGAQLQAWPWQVHATLALLTLAVNLWAFRIEHTTLTENALILQAVMDEVDRIRRARGLASNATALAEEAPPRRSADG